MAYQNRNTTSSRNRLSDRDMLMDILTTSKYMSSLYDHAILESTNIMIRDSLAELQQDEHDTAEMLFTGMQQQGMYNTGANRQKSGKRSGKQNQYNNYNNVQQAGNMKANSQYAVSSGSNRFGRRLSSGKGLSASAIREQAQPGLFNPRSTWNV